MKIKMSFSEKLLTIHRQKLDTIEQSTMDYSQRKKIKCRTYPRYYIRSLSVDC